MEEGFDRPEPAMERSPSALPAEAGAEIDYDAVADNVERRFPNILARLASQPNTEEAR